MTDLIDRAHSQEEPTEPGGAGEPAAPTPAAAPTPQRGRRSLDMTTGNRWALSALLAAAGVVHLVMAPSHLGMSASEGWGFVVAGWLQVGLAAAVLVRPARWMLQLSVVANLALIATWAYSRTAGLPFGAHADRAESVTIVDGSVVALEVAAVLLALALLLPGARRLVALNGGAVAAFVPVAAFALATVAIASPQARDHAAGGHGHEEMAGEAGHGHGAEAAADDKGLSLLDNGHQHGQDELVELDDATQAELAVQLAGTHVLIERYPTVADAEAAGYMRSGPFAPGAGAHYRPAEGWDIDTDGVISGDDIEKPLLIFDGIEPDSPLAGFMYYMGGETVPEGFVGDNDVWHHHENVCVVYRPDGQIDTPFLADTDATEDMCSDIDGEWLDVTGYMVHVWTVPGYETPGDTFAEINPAITCPDGTYYQIPDEEVGYKTSTCRNP